MVSEASRLPSLATNEAYSDKGTHVYDLDADGNEAYINR